MISQSPLHLLRLLKMRYFLVLSLDMRSLRCIAYKTFLSASLAASISIATAWTRLAYYNAPRLATRTVQKEESLATWYPVFEDNKFGIVYYGVAKLEMHDEEPPLPPIILPAWMTDRLRNPQLGTLDYIKCGWPRYCLFSIDTRIDGKDNNNTMLILNKQIRVPDGILFYGLIFNTALLMPILFGLLMVSPVLRSVARARRRRSGRCVYCAYYVEKSLLKCSECGKDIGGGL